MCVKGCSSTARFSRRTGPGRSAPSTSAWSRRERRTIPRSNSSTRTGTRRSGSTSLAGVFVFDDGPAIADNPHIHHLWPLSTAMAAPPDSTVSGRPIVSLTLALNYALTPDLWGYHAVNLAIHVLAALTPFGIVRRTLATGGRHVSDTSLTPLALCIALLWAVHPLQTSAVTYVVQRAESLMGLFSLLTLYC